MTWRTALLKIHLYLGLAGAIFLAILGLTGSIIAFETDIPHWLNRDLFYVTPAAQTLPEQELIRLTEQRTAPAKVTAVQYLRSPDLVRVMQLTGGVRAFVNPYNGTLLGTMNGSFPSQRILGNIHQIHLRLLPDPKSAPSLAGPAKTLVSFAGLLLCLLVPTGLILFWKTRRTTVKWSASWFRICFDLHHVIGLFASVFLFVVAFTGVLIGFDFGERAIFALTGSVPPRPPPQVHSSPVPGASPIGIDRAIEVAMNAVTGASLAGYSLPTKPNDVYTVQLRVPEETSDSVNSRVAVDQFSGRALYVRDFRAISPGTRWIRFNRSVHTGDIAGTPTHILMSLSSLLLVVLVFTGVVIWWRKLAI